MPENKPGLGKREPQGRKEEAQQQREGGVGPREESPRRNEEAKAAKESRPAEPEVNPLTEDQQEAEKQGTRVWNQWNDETATDIQKQVTEEQMARGEYTGGAIIDAEPEELNKASIRKIHE